jgi:hypothetical protein
MLFVTGTCCANRSHREGHGGSLSASHCSVLAVCDEVYAHKVMALVKEAGISNSTNPHISLVAQRVMTWNQSAAA